MNERTLRKIKLVYITHSLNAGGAERFLVDMINTLSHERFEIVLICMKDRGILAAEIQNPAVALYEIGKHNKIDVSALRRLYRVLKHIQPDIVHTHLRAGDLWGRLMAVVCHVPIILSTEHNLHTVDMWFEKIFKRFLNRWTQKIVFVSEAVRQYYSDHISLSALRQEVISNGVVTERFFCQREILVTPRIHLLMVGRFAEQKGHQYLISALAEMKDFDWECRFVGDGERRTAMEQLVRDSGIQDRVQFLGIRHDIAQLMQAADVFVLPSLYEGQGMVLLEAAVAGCCLVATQTSGIAELLEHDRTAVLVAPKDVTALASGLRWVFEHRAAAQALARSAQQEVMQKYDFHRTVDAYEELYVRSFNQWHGG